MTTQYHYNRNKKNKSKFFIWLIIFLLMGIVVFSSITNFFGGTTHAIFRPVWIFGNSISEIGGNIDSVLMSKAELIKENQVLKDDLLYMSLLVMERTILKKENQDLKGLLGYDSENERVLASILSTGETSPYGSIVIDQGLSSGIAVNDIVYVANIGVGTVEQVYRKTALVRLFTDSGQVVEVLVGDDNIVATVHGNGGGNFFFDLPRDVEVKIGDKIMLLGGQERMLGIVGHIDVKPNDPFKRLIFRSPVDIKRVRWIEVEIHENE